MALTKFELVELWIHNIAAFGCNGSCFLFFILVHFIFKFHM